MAIAARIGLGKLPKIRIKRIIVTTDFSESSGDAFQFAIQIAKEFGAAITLLFVYPTSLPGELSHIGIVLEQKRLVARAREELAAIRKRKFPVGVCVEAVVLEGGPAFEIVRYAKQTEADLIIMCTHGHSGLKHFWVGSTAENVIRHAPCPVLVIHGRTQKRKEAHLPYAED